jgi:hypothetical protein
MKKKGASHIDWVVSIGIFIVYILLLLVWIKPSYKPVFEESSLINIVKGNIEKDIDDSGFTWKVTTNLLKLDCTGGTGTYDVDDFDDLIPGLSVNHFDVRKTSDDTRADYEGKLKVNLYSASGKNNYWVISSSANYGQNSGDLGVINPAISCDHIGGQPIVKVGFTNNLLQGLNPSKVSGWGFPDSRDFKIILDDLNNGITCYGRDGSVNCDSLEPDSNAVVYASEWRYNILDAQGDSEPVLLNILVW